jgi:glutamyl-tRNA synthetase
MKPGLIGYWKISDSVSVRGRFAPSPTGHLHLGNARTALLAWLHALARGGTLVLRVEDLDAGRVRPAFRASQLADLRWLGLDWDEGPDVGGDFGPYLQSLRTDLYDQAIDKLRSRNLVYPCRCTRKEIAAAVSAPHQEDEEGPAYPGTCRDRPFISSETEYALRFRVPAGSVCFEDQLQGRVAFDPASSTGDFVVSRKDGVAAYQLATVVDDAAMRITDVVRGADLLASTARQLLLYRALELDPPRWMHVPLLLDEAGGRLAKREGALTLSALRERGARPERVIGWLAWTCGLTEREREVMPADLVGVFDPGRISRSDTRATVPAWLEPAA